MKIAILGGTGNEGFGLGFRWALTGHKIIIGSRLTEKGKRAAEKMKDLAPQAEISGTNNLSATEQAEIVVLSVPYAAQEATLEAVKDALGGKLLVTVVAPTSEKAARVRRLPSGLSAAEEAQQQIGEITRVVAAFQNIGAHHLLDVDHQMDCDVLVCGEKGADKKIVLQLCEDAGMRGVNAGALQNASVAEGLTSLLIAVNVIYKVKSAGIRVTGL
ncbi:MAG: NADPH-dependent F420 reductase [Candidatus Promineifilaceae bacterium]|nr:NADPH-dependent F420 reductase [Candidatus Promineifilaceae bacterium]